MGKICSICFGSDLSQDFGGESCPENDLIRANKFSEVRRFPRFVSSYLNFMRETLNHEMGTDAHFTELEEPVCVDCFSLLESFCRAFRQWEKFHLELSWTLGKISEAINQRQTRNYGTDQQEGAQHGVDNFSVFIETANKRVKKRLPCVKSAFLYWEPRNSSEKSDLRDDSSSSLRENLMHLESSSAASPIDNLCNSRTSTSPKILDADAKELFSDGGDDQSDQNYSDHEAGPDTPEGGPFRGESQSQQDAQPRRQLKHACLMCFGNFQFKSLLEFHMRTHTQEKPYICKACGMEWAGRSGYLKHQWNVHNRQLGRLKVHSSHAWDRDHHIISTGKPYGCIMCPAKFWYTCMLDKHIRTHTHERAFFCKECGFESSTSWNRKVHRKIHSQQLQERKQKRRYDCLHCGCNYPTKRALKMHIKNTVNAQQLKCNICEKVFTKEVNFKKHYIVMHTIKDKSFECTTCGKKFATKQYLKWHEAVHQKDHKNHMCKYCGKRFVGEHHRNLHEKLHQGEKSFQCKVCNKTFGFRNTLRSHERTHNPEQWMQCQFCEKRFVLKATLERHEKTHSSEKSFMCPVCGKGFKDKWEMGRHKEIHNEDNTYQCEACDLAFKTKRYLRRHVRKEHKWKLEIGRNQSIRT